MNLLIEHTLNEWLTEFHELYDYSAVVVILSSQTDRQLLSAFVTTFLQPNGCLFKLSNELKVRSFHQSGEYGIQYLYFTVDMPDSKLSAEAVLAAMNEDPRYADPWLRNSLRLEER